MSATAQAIPLRTVVGVSGAAAIGSAAAAYQPWVDFRSLGIDMYWNGFGVYGGSAPVNYGALLETWTLINPLGWVIVAFTVLAGIAVVVATQTVPWLRLVGLGFAAAACVTAAAGLIRPELLVGDLLAEFGIEPLGARLVVNTSWLWAEVAVTGIFLLTIVGLTFAARRTPPAA